jgi:hypothetical protein
MLFTPAPYGSTVSHRAEFVRGRKGGGVNRLFNRLVFVLLPYHGGKGGTSDFRGCPVSRLDVLN